MDKEFIEVTDDDFHHYVIPFEKKEEWNTFLEIDSDDERGWEVPVWAERIDGGQVVFKNYRIG